MRETREQGNEEKNMEGKKTTYFGKKQEKRKIVRIEKRVLLIPSEGFP